MASSSHKTVSELLGQLGLVEHDSQVYLSVMGHGRPTTGQLVKDTGLHREQIYRSLSRLAEMGMIMAGGDESKNRYQASDPKVLIEMVEVKRKAAIAAERSLRGMFTRQAQVIQVREGREALKELSDDISRTVKKDGEYLIMGGAWREFSRLAHDYLPSYHRQLKKKGIGGRILSYQGHDASGERAMGWHIQTRVLDEPHQNIASTIIYGDKVAIDILDPENVAVIIIQNAKVAEHYRQTFETLWALARE